MSSQASSAAHLSHKIIHRDGSRMYHVIIALPSGLHIQSSCAVHNIADGLGFTFTLYTWNLHLLVYLRQVAHANVNSIWIKAL